MIILNVKDENSQYIIDNILNNHISKVKLNASILTKKVSKYR